MNKILPNAYLEKYQQLLEILLRVQAVGVDLVELSASVMPVDTEDFGELQDFYQKQIFPLVDKEFSEEVLPEIASRWRSLNTEIHRSMKLLALDISLLKAARSPQMQKTRRQGMSDRLSTLISYCQVLLAPEPTKPT
jgi:hypothetical protein